MNDAISKFKEKIISEFNELLNSGEITPDQSSLIARLRAKIEIELRDY